MSRTKRAAAKVAETKIKRFLEEREKEKALASTKMPGRASNTAVTKDAFAFNDEELMAKKASKQRKKKVSKVMNSVKSTTNREDVPFDESSQLRNAFSHLIDSHESSVLNFQYDNNEEEELTLPVESSAVRHAKRRARRSINSDRKMEFSMKSSYRMSIDSTVYPYSPILAERLSFEDVAHIPKTPLFS